MKGLRETNGRHELKHYINRLDLYQLKSKLSCVMSYDKNGNTENGYRIRSLYFDNYNDKALKQKVDGVDEREKFRIRFYNNDPSFIRLEKKSKQGGVCFKKNEIISYQTCKAILEGDYEALKANKTPLHLELYAKMQYEQLRPKNIVDYQRIAFVYKPGNVRVTLDHEIRSGLNVLTFLDPEYITVPIPEVFILEVKYDNFLPEVIRGITTLSSRSASAFSKYAATRII